MPTFETFTDKAGQFRFRLKAKNGEIILASEGYTTKAARDNGIESVRTNCTNAASSAFRQTPVLGGTGTACAPASGASTTRQQ